MIRPASDRDLDPFRNAVCQPKTGTAKGAEKEAALRENPAPTRRVALNAVVDQRPDIGAEEISDSGVACRLGRLLCAGKQSFAKRMVTISASQIL